MAERAVAPVANDLVAAVVANLRRVVHAADDTLRLVVLCLVAEGHLIIEDFPGVGKTTLAKALAKSLDQRYESAVTLAADLRGVSAMLAARSETQDAAAVFVPAQPARRTGGRWILLLVLAALFAAAWFGRDWLQ